MVSEFIFVTRVLTTHIIASLMISSSAGSYVVVVN